MPVLTCLSTRSWDAYINAKLCLCAPKIVTIHIWIKMTKMTKKKKNNTTTHVERAHFQSHASQLCFLCSCGLILLSLLPSVGQGFYQWISKLVASTLGHFPWGIRIRHLYLGNKTPEKNKRSERICKVSWYAKEWTPSLAEILSLFCLACSRVKIQLICSHVNQQTDRDIWTAEMRDLCGIPMKYGQSFDISLFRSMVVQSTFCTNMHPLCTFALCKLFLFPLVIIWP